MNLSKRLATIGIAALMMASTGIVSAQYAAPRGGYDGGQGGWDAPPPEIANDAQRRGFHDGIEGARKDYENHRQPNVNNRDEYRHPSVGRELRHDYREGFRRGYDVGVSHMMNGRDHDHDGDRH